MMSKEMRQRLQKEAAQAAEILRKIWVDVCAKGSADDVRGADEAYRRAAMLRDHLETT